jgi:hypothetical protein
MAQQRHDRQASVSLYGSATTGGDVDVLLEGPEWVTPSDVGCLLGLSADTGLTPVNTPAACLPAVG